ncbi:hypothetical protein [Streptomyces prasinus]|uniref:hypothetical protein n=1 Tax=Streptomyces prasinus TaxID=67345 RepID=UPI0033256D60
MNTRIRAEGSPDGSVEADASSRPGYARTAAPAAEHAVTGEKVARDRDPDPEDSTPDAVADLTCPGLGPIAGSRVHIAGLFGGGLHTTADGWPLEAVTPAWPDDRVLLSVDGGLPHSGPYGEQWWHTFHSTYSELRAFGFSPSGETIAVATSSDVSLWTRRPEHSNGSVAQH